MAAPANQSQPPATGTPATGTTTTTQQPPAFKWDEWAKDEKNKDLATHIQTHFDGSSANLKKALDAERETRSGLENQLKELKKTVEAGSETAKKLDEISATLDAERVRVSFYEQAHAAGCNNPRLAFLYASDAGLIGKNGSANMEAVKAANPSLFAAPQTQTGAAPGTGTGTPPTPPAGTGKNSAINDALRAKAGLK